MSSWRRGSQNCFGHETIRVSSVVHVFPNLPLLTGQWNDWTGAYDGMAAATADALCNDNGALVWINRVNGVPRELIRYRPGSFAADRDIATDEPTFRLATADSGNSVLPLADVACADGAIRPREPRRPSPR